GHFFHRAELAEVHLRDRRDAGATGRAGRRVLAPLQRGLDVGLHVFLEDAAFGAGAGDGGQVDAELAGDHAHGRSRVYLAAVAHGRGDRGGGRGQGGDGTDLGGHLGP